MYIPFCLEIVATGFVILLCTVLAMVKLSRYFVSSLIIAYLFFLIILGLYVYDVSSIFLLYKNYFVGFAEIFFILTLIIILLYNYWATKLRSAIYLNNDLLVLILLSTLGIVYMMAAVDLMLVYLSMEMISLTFYVLVASDRNSLKSIEAGLKYFVLGSYSTSLFLLGTILIYASTGTTSLLNLKLLFMDSSFESFFEITFLFFIGSLLIISAFLFKLSSFPFHFWTPDVYEGSQIFVLWYISVVGKIPFFCYLMQFLLLYFFPFLLICKPVLWFFAIGSMFVGLIGAVFQETFKRFLAYTTIANIGYMILFFYSASFCAFEGVAFYFFMYIFLVLSFFSVWTLVMDSRLVKHFLNMIDLTSFFYNCKLLGWMFILVLLSLAGLPPFGGFLGKYLLLEALLIEDAYWTIFIIVILTSYNFYIYLRVIGLMLFIPGTDVAGYVYRSLLTNAFDRNLLLVYILMYLQISFVFGFFDYALEFLVYLFVVSFF